MRNFK